MIAGLFRRLGGGRRIHRRRAEAGRAGTDAARRAGRLDAVIAGCSSWPGMGRSEVSGLRWTRIREEDVRFM